jgi:hypothetical protein
MDQKIQFFSPKLFDFFGEDMMKYTCINLTPYTNLIQFIEEESIILDEETLNSIENEFKEKIQELFLEYQSVFIKLNFSAPTDSQFLVHELKCINLNDILTLIKGSSKLSDNINIFQQNKDSSELYLITKPWYKMDQRNEFRLFIDDKELKGICQRHLNFYFDYSEHELEEIEEAILMFLDKHSDKFEDDHISKRLIVDVLYMKKFNRIKVVDVLSEENRQCLHNVSLEYTEGENWEDDHFLLFENWNNLINNSEPEFKVIKSYQEIIDTEENLNRFPLEIIGEDNKPNVEKIIELLKNQ